MDKLTLPTIDQLASMEITERDKNNALNVLLNQSPPKSWLKKQDGVTHLPVDKVRFLLTKIFVEWNEKIQSVQVIANSVVVVITLNYLNPITGNWQSMDGIGAAPINTKSGKTAMDWENIVHDSVHKCAGAADAFALKNAAKKIGRIFGAELMQDDKIDYNSLLDAEKFQNAKITEK